MLMSNPIGKIVSIVPKRGGLVKEGELLQLTKNYATILNSKGEEQSIPLSGENISLTQDQIIKDIEKGLPYKLKPEGKTRLKEILKVYNNILNSY